MALKTRANREGVQDQLRTLIRRARAVADGLDPAAFNRAPEPGSWSVGQCLEHLNESARLYLPELTEAADAARAEGRLARPGRSDRTMLGRFVAWSQEPPVRLRMKTFQEIDPDETERLDPAEVLEAFEALHEELVVRRNEAQDLDLKRIRVPSVLMPRLKLSLGDWYHFLAAHGRRHLWQAEQARARLGA